MKKVVIVGAGMSGLIAAAYLSKNGNNVLLLEKNNNIGGLVNSFNHEGFVFDIGAKSIENAGVIKPVLKDLGIGLKFVKSHVSVGVENKVINIFSKKDLSNYEKMLVELYPESKKDIKNIIIFVEKILKDMEVLYGFDNPFFRDYFKDKEFFLKKFLPWIFKFFFTVSRINGLQEPVESFLKKKSSNQSLIDIVSQHFFKNTPLFFALGYFYIYLDYLYPMGGTGQLPKVIGEKIVDFGGKIKTNTRIVSINVFEKKLTDNKGKVYSYDELIWSADLKSLYQILKTNNLDSDVILKILNQKKEFKNKHAGESVFNLMLGVNKPLKYFEKISNPHFFYTPFKKGLDEIHRSSLKSLLKNFNKNSKKKVLEWLDDFCKYNTYEISIPALRDSSLAPKGKVGLIISLLFEYDLVKKVKDAGWYAEFKKEVEKRVIKTLSNSIYPGLEKNIIFKYSFTPLNYASMAGTSEGGITGWSFESKVPVVNNLTKFKKAIITPIPNVLQTGQWVYSPAGIPTAIITGWLAAQEIIKKKK